MHFLKSSSSAQCKNEASRERTVERMPKPARVLVQSDHGLGSQHFLQSFQGNDVQLDTTEMQTPTNRVLKGNKYIFRGRRPCQIVLLSFWKRIYAKRMEFTVLVFFHLEKTPFQKSIGLQKPTGRQKSCLPYIKRRKCSQVYQLSPLECQAKAADDSLFIFDILQSK